MSICPREEAKLGGFMMKNAMTLGACLVSWTASAAPELDVSGDCPGDVTIEVTDLDPYATVTVVYGEEALPGDSLDIPRGPCAGVETDLATGKRGFDLTDSDGDGRIRFTTWVSADRCGTPFHVLDVDSCEISNLNYVPDAEDDYTDYYLIDTDYYEHYYDVYEYSYGGTSTTDPLTRYEYYDSVYGEPTSTGGPYTPTSYYDAYYEELVYHYYDTLYVDEYDTSTSVIYVSEIYDLYAYYADTLEAYYTDGTLYAYYYGSGSTTYHDSYDETYEDCRYEYYYDYCEYIGTVTSSYPTTYEDYYGPTTYYSYIEDYYYYVYEVYYGSSATSTWLTWDYSSAYTATLYAYYFSTLYDSEAYEVYSTYGSYSYSTLYTDGYFGTYDRSTVSTIFMYYDRYYGSYHSTYAGHYEAWYTLYTYSGYSRDYSTGSYEGGSPASG